MLKGEAAREFGRPSRRLRAPKPSQSPRSPWRRPAFQVMALGVLGVLPFVVLVRGSVYFYEARAWPAWLALGAAASCTLVLVGAYGAWVTRRITGRARFSTVLKWVALPLVAGYGAHALMFLSSSHAADAAVRAEYRATHPLLRIALSTLSLARRDLLITDLSRIPADYPRMGLPVNDGTLHYVQRDGWSHAVDLQTGGRSEIVNRFVEVYFRAMGFRTRRHVGTGDHLHVELPVN
jgi:hypothetical protein